MNGIETTLIQRPMAVERRTFFWSYFGILTAFFIGYLWNVRPTLSPNDNSRWNTVWSLVEYGTYQIFDTKEDAEKFDKPQQLGTIDKVMIDGKTYSSKPPLLPTVIAGYVKLLQWVIHEPFTIDQRDPFRPGSINIYAKATLLLFNLVPFLVFLVLYRRFLDRYAESDYGWCYGLLAAGLGTFLTGYLVTLNNHVLAGCFGFYTFYQLVQVQYEGRRELWRFALTGLCAALTAANEMPGGLLVLIAFFWLLRVDWGKTLAGFVAPALLVTVAFVGTNYLATGSIVPAYLRHSLYDFPGSYWAKTAVRSGIDALNEHPENKFVYFLHMTIGHHGWFSLTPLWFIAAVGFWRYLRGAERRLGGIHWPILGLSVVVFEFYWLGFYWLGSNQHNYGGFCHGLRWLLWLGPLWLLVLPAGLDPIAGVKRWRHWANAALLISIVSMADTLYNPWTRSWLHRIFLWFGIVDY